MRERIILGMLGVLVIVICVALLLLLQIPMREGTVGTLPTLVALPSVTVTDRPTRQPTSTVTSTATVRFTPTLTATLRPTLTPTLTQRLLEMQVVMPGVYVAATPTPFPSGTILLPAPPQPLEPLPDATDEPPPYRGWYSFESDHPLVRYSTPWQARQVREASRGQYHRTENTSSSVSFPFEGEGLRVRYVAARNMGIFEILVDGQLLDTIDAYAESLVFPGTQVYFVGSGQHTLTIRPSGGKSNASSGYAIGLDAIQVFRGSPNTLIIPPVAESTTPAPPPQPAAGIDLVAAPPTLQPTATPIAPGLLSVAVVVAYDENGNRAVDPAEGVNGISVRAVEVGTNRVIAQAFTDAQGYAGLQVVTAAEARIVVPYFGTVWEVPRSQSGGGQAAFTLLLEPGNQPGLIP